MSGMRDFVIQWNNKYPLDRWFREKYKLRFNSQEHRGTNLVDVYFQFVEERIFEDIRKESREKAEKEKRYQEEGWLRPRKVEVPDEIFDDLDYSAFDDDTEEDSI